MWNERNESKLLKTANNSPSSEKCCKEAIDKELGEGNKRRIAKRYDY